MCGKHLYLLAEMTMWFLRIFKKRIATKQEYKITLSINVITVNVNESVLSQTVSVDIT